MESALEAEEAEWEAWEKTQDYASRMHLPVEWMPLPARVRFEPPLTEDELLRFSETNDIVWIEREADGAIYMRPIHPTFYGLCSGKINGRLGIWAEEDGRGACYGRAGWKLPDGSMRGATISWALNERVDKFSEEERKGFLPIAPDFIVELLSPLYDRDYQLAKMEQWIANGVQVAWLIDPETKTVKVYRPGESVEVFENPAIVHGTGPVRGFELEMARVWVSFT